MKRYGRDDAVRPEQPVPGRQPFIEAEGYWADFHQTFIPTFREAVLAVLPASYDIRIDQEILFRASPDEPSRSRTGKPDVAVIERRRMHLLPAQLGEGQSTAVLDVPEVELDMPDVEETGTPEQRSGGLPMVSWSHRSSGSRRRIRTAKGTRCFATSARG